MKKKGILTLRALGFLKVSTKKGNGMCKTHKTSDEIFKFLDICLGRK